MAVKEIEFTFEYDIPDKYLYLTNDLGLTTTFTYRGPARIWIVVDRETRKILPAYGWVTEMIPNWRCKQVPFPRQLPSLTLVTLIK